MTTVAIHQPNYLPWIGFFHKMAHSDIFVLFDDVQLPLGKSYTPRTMIKTGNGTLKLTIPLLKRNDLLNIRDIKINNTLNWRKKHLRTIQYAYKKAKYFSDYIHLFEDVFEQEWNYLAELNSKLISIIKKTLDIKTELILSSQLDIGEADGLEKILKIVKVLNADTYFTGVGIGTQRYMNEKRFNDEKIKVVYQDFVHPIYTQLWNDEFVEGLSILDLLFNCGFDSRKHLFD